MAQPLDILHLEDSPPDAELVREALRAAGIECAVTHVTTGEAFAAALPRHPDLILVDHNVPSFGGFAAIAAALERVPDVPIIMVTGSLGEEGAVETLRRGATDYVLKEHVNRLGPAVRRALTEVEARRQRERAEQEFRAAFEDAPIGMALAGPDRRFMRANRALCAILGYTEAELRELTFLDVAHPDDRAIGLRDAQLAFEAGQLVPPHETRYVRKDGSTVWIQVTISPIRGAAGRPQYAIGMLEDLSERRRAEAARQALEGQLRQSQKMEALGHFASGIAHDFNNILAIVLAEAELLASALLPDRDDLRTDLRAIEDAAKRGKEMVRRLMAFSRSEALAMQRLDLVAHVRESAATLHHLLSAAVTMHFDLEAGPLWVLADPTVIEQCLMNLATNARDAMPEGGTLTLRVTRRQIDAAVATVHAIEPGEYAVVQVADTGIGMDEQTVQRAFEPLFTTKPRDKGTGLGLSMVHGLIRQHRGWVRLESEVGKGSVVELALPLAEAGPSAAGAERAGRTSGAERLRGTETVLIADDEEALRKVAQRTLEHYGYTVLTAADGLEALAIVRREGERIRLVISDVSMPQLTGPDLYRALRAEGRNVPFLFTSGYDRPEVGAVAAGARAMPKPWTIEELLVAVRAALDAAR